MGFVEQVATEKKYIYWIANVWCLFGLGVGFCEFANMIIFLIKNLKKQKTIFVFSTATSKTENFKKPNICVCSAANHGLFFISNIIIIPAPFFGI